MPKFQTHTKFQTHAKFQTHIEPCQILNPCKKLIDPRQNFIDPCNPRDPRKFLTHTIHAPMYPRAQATHVTHESPQPVQFSRVVGK